METNEYHVYGIPGAGKTTYVSNKIKELTGNGNPARIIISSFTKAAAAELVSRSLDVPDQNIGTLHSLCFHALGAPTIAETKIDEFNAENKVYSLHNVSANINEGDGGLSAMQQASSQQNDMLFQSIQRKRSMMIPRERWSQKEKEMFEAWENFKKKHDYLDFTDLIEWSYQDKSYPPHRATLGFFDEAQDFTPLQLELIRMWSMNMDYIVLSGDDDQSLYSFLGADPEKLIGINLPEDHKLFLERSYRVPKKIQEFASRIISTVKVREKKKYFPKQDAHGEDVEGLVIKSDMTTTKSKDVCSFVEKEIEQDKEVMILASCSYMLTSIISELRSQGIPFHNKYKTDNAMWNPVRIGGKRVSTGDRILAYLDPKGVQFGNVRLWDAKQTAQWIDLCMSKKILVHGAKKKIMQAAKDSVEDEDLLRLFAECFIPEKLDEAVKLQLSWLVKHMKKSKIRVAEYVLKILERDGIYGVTKTPKVIVGTIHSVKGGQADTVVLFPDLSTAALRSSHLDARQRQRDAIARMFYVGATRAKEKLVLCRPASRLFLDFSNYINQ